MSRQAVIVGAAETSEIGKLPTLSNLDHHVDAAMNALRDAGLTIDDVDGIASTGSDPVVVARALGIEPAWLDSTMVGGCTPMLHLRHAIAAIERGQCTTVLIT